MHYYRYYKAFYLPKTDPSLVITGKFLNKKLICYGIIFFKKSIFEFDFCYAILWKIRNV